MIDWTWITTSLSAAGMVVLGAVGIYLVLLMLTRLVGLRSFSKMSSFDFALTVAMGSLLASVLLTKDPPLLQGMAGLAALYGIRWSVAKLREANVLQYDQVRAVVFETTGDISVLHGATDGPALDPDLLANVRGVERLKAAGDEAAA